MYVYILHEQQMNIFTLQVIQILFYVISELSLAEC